MNSNSENFAESLSNSGNVPTQIASTCDAQYKRLLELNENFYSK